MDTQFDQNLENYANVITHIGLNIQPGQRLLIGAPMYEVWGVPIELSALVRKITASAYRRGASLVDVLWNDEALQLIRYSNARANTFHEYPTWRTTAATKAVHAGDAVIVFYAEDPDLLKDRDPLLISAILESSVSPMKEFSDLRRRNATNCCVLSGPIVGWSDSVFPEYPPEERMGALWDAIFDACRIKTNDPISEWKEHIQELKRICDYLNQKNYSSIIFQGPTTNLTVGLVENHIWKCAAGTNPTGIEFIANLPTEEVFTLPHREKIEGVVSSTKPLYYGGTKIEDFTLTFERGRVTNLAAKQGEKFLREELERDEGASSLGEVALVPHSSPISQSGLTFNNILFDENASSHLAIGAGYRFNLKEGEDMSDEEFIAKGGNVSKIHLDFMIGSEQINVNGQRNGDLEPIMHNGEWVIG